MATWKPIQDFPNYEVSDEGQIRYRGGWQHRAGSASWRRPPAIVAQHPDKDGYLKVTFLKDGRRQKRSAHRIVALAFIPNRYRKPEVNHLDGDKTNNTARNLEWSTCKENHSHRRHVLLKNLGNEHGMSKLTEEIVREIRASKESHASLGRKYGVSAQTIGFARRRQTWQHV